MVGVDVSAGMFAEARNNAQELRANNITFVHSDDTLSSVSRQFDLINSFIVFQHIPTARGEVILHRLREAGVGMLQFTYGYSSSTSVVKRLQIRAYFSPWLYGVRNLLKGRPFALFGSRPSASRMRVPGSATRPSPAALKQLPPSNHRVRR
jgi:SAM-dependent methyltransferase